MGVEYSSKAFQGLWEEPFQSTSLREAGQHVLRELGGMLAVCLTPVGGLLPALQA